VIIPRPEIGSRVRITANWPSGLKTITEGTYTGWSEPDWELDGFFRVSYLPEPADGTWVTTPNREPGRPPYVFHRDDAVLRYESSPEYRWWFHEDGEWTTWAEVQKHGVATIIKASGAA
jgi:hypothetical protein